MTGDAPTKAKRQDKPSAGLPAMTSRRIHAGVIVIGDEVLSGKVVDRNSPTLIAAMSEHGIVLGELAVLADDQDRIAQVVADFAARFQLVVTTGGVGPTHDDCTWRAVAQALGEPIVMRTDMLGHMEHYNHGPLTAEQKRMAMLPQRATLIEDGPALIAHIDHIWVLPGVPSMVNRAAAWLCARHEGPRPWLATVFMTVDEWLAISEIDAIVTAFPDLTVGSYPVFDAADHRLRLTFEGPERTRVEAAVNAQVAAIGSEHLVRVDWRPGNVGN